MLDLVGRRRSAAIGGVSDLVAEGVHAPLAPARGAFRQPAIGFVVLAIASFLTTTTVGQVQVRVATYNLEFFDETSGPKFDAIVDTLDRICADVVCVQEIDDSAAFANLASAAGYPHHVLASTSGAIDFNLRSGVMSVYPISSWSFETSESLSGDRDAKDLTRNFIVAEIAVPGATQPLVIVGNHWKSGGTEDANEFRRSVEAVRTIQATAPYNSTVVPYFVVGDMNDDILDSADSPSQFTSVPGGMPASFVLGSDMSFPILNGVFKPLQNATGSQDLTVLNPLQLDGNDATRNSSGRRLDYVWRSQAVTLVGSEVYDSVDDNNLGGGRPKCGPLPSSGTSAAASDHLAVFADVQIPGGAPTTGACCNGLSCTNGVSSGACTGGGGTYQGNGSTCAMVTCGPTTGACCDGEDCTNGVTSVTCAGSGGTYQGNGTTCAMVTCDVAANVIINEIDCDQIGNDAAEFIELFDGGAGNTDLTGLVVVLYTGSDDTSYLAQDLDGFSTDSDGYFVIGSTGMATADIALAPGPNGWLQNGEDAVALYVGSGVNFPMGTAVTTTDLIDALVYETNDPLDAGLLVLLNPGQPQIDESGGGNPTVVSIGRCANGEGGARNTNTYVRGTPTPDASNNCSGACCVTGNCSASTSEDACAALTGEYQGYLTTCGGVTCPAVGACCTQGVCADDVMSGACVSGGGTFQGNASACVTTTCETGACCISGACFDAQAEAVCVIDGGIYQGDDSTCGATTCPAGPVINEIRIDQIDVDNDEYFELAGPAGHSLVGLTYLVIGDNVGGTGSIEAVVEIDEYALDANGFFTAAEATFTLASANVTTSLNFENQDNVTHLLVLGFTGAIGQDLDTNDDGTLDVTPWSAVLDCVAVLDLISTELGYCPSASVGPIGAAIGHVARCPDVSGGWYNLSFDVADGDDSPGAANICVTGACCPQAGGCRDGVLAGDCSDPGDLWFAGQDCSQGPCGAIPTVGQWGYAILTMLLMISGSIVFGGRREASFAESE